MRRRRKRRRLGTLAEFWNEGRLAARRGEMLRAEYHYRDCARARYIYLGWKHERAVMLQVGLLPQLEMPLQSATVAVADSA